MSNIIQLTDTHIVERGVRAYGVVDTASALMKAVSTINRLPEFVGPIDAVIVTGDLTDFGTEAEYQVFREITASLKTPLAVLPGNHDRREPLRRAFADLSSMPEQGPMNWCLSFDDMSIIGLDCLVEGAPHGELTEQTLAWLAETLDRLPDKPVLVATHHHPFESKIVHMDKQGLRNADQMIDILVQSSRTVSFVCGHVHRLIATVHRGIPMTIGPSPSHAVALDHRVDGPANLMLEPGGFLLHSTSSKPGGLTSIVSEYVPSGVFDGPYPFFG